MDIGWNGREWIINTAGKWSGLNISISDLFETVALQ